MRHSKKAIHLPVIEQGGQEYNKAGTGIVDKSSGSRIQNAEHRQRDGNQKPRLMPTSL